MQNTGQNLVHLSQDGSVYVNNVLENITIFNMNGVNNTATPGELIPVAAGQTVALTINFVPTPNEQLTSR